jgi:ABC-type antimicrobial peptide transport system permease subunit
MLLSWDFIKLVVTAFFIAMPVAYYFMNEWLENFVYRADMSVNLFILPGLTAVAIAWFTVGYQSVKAARSNPVKALRFE